MSSYYTSTVYRKYRKLGRKRYGKFAKIFFDRENLLHNFHAMIVFSIIWEKILEDIRKESLRNIYKTFTKIVSTTFLFFFLVDIPENIKRLKYAVFLWDMVFLKIVVSILIVWKFSAFISLWNYIEEWFEWMTVKDTREWYGVPITEIVEYLFLNKNFPRQNIMDLFWVSRSTADIMASEMERVKILIRWENNGRVINPEMGRSDIVSILSKNVWGELQTLFRKVDGWFSHAPSLSKENDDFSGFVTNPIK